VRIFNTLGRALQPLRPREAGKIAMYVCGATVQSEPHLGHGRCAVVFDVVRRYLEWRGYQVTYVRNITDVEDKIIAAAAERGVDVAELAALMEKQFQQAYDALGVLPPTSEPRATEHIPEMMDLIQRLLDKDLAYVADGDVYFSVRGWEPYGRLSGQKLDDLVAGARVEPGEQKRDPLDFALWKAAKPGEPTWDSPWGPGRPGWHIECSAMSLKYLGPDFDIHGGGTDLIFPHHENEIAQSEGATGRRFARVWMHNGMLNLSGEKMSKSVGNIIDLATALERYPPMAVRLYYLRAHYRSPLEYSEELLEDAASSFARLWSFRRRLPRSVGAGPDRAVLDGFRAAMDDDFNTPEALGVLFDVVREGNRALDRGDSADAFAATFDEITSVLGMAAPESELSDVAAELSALAADLGVETSGTPEAVVEAILERRRQAREAQNWAESDRIRARLGELGIAVEDTPDGALWHRG
jgi:cysteinyl-tRNA synthetase